MKPITLSQTSADNSGTGAVKAGDWISEGDLAALGINADLTVFFE